MKNKQLFKYHTYQGKKYFNNFESQSKTFYFINFEISCEKKMKKDQDNFLETIKSGNHEIIFSKKI